MKMAQRHDAQSKDSEMMMKQLESAYEFLRSLFDQKGKCKPDFGKTIHSPDSEQFWKTMKVLSKDHKTSSPTTVQEPQKLQVGGKIYRDTASAEARQSQDEKARSVSAGVRDERDAADAKDKGGSAVLMEQPNKTGYKTTVYHRQVSSEGDSKPNSSQTGVDSGSAYKSLTTTQKSENDLQQIADDRLKQIKEKEDEIKELQNKILKLEESNEITVLVQNKNEQLMTANEEIVKKNKVLNENLDKAKEDLKKAQEATEYQLEIRNQHLNQILHIENEAKKHQETAEEKQRKIMDLEVELKNVNKDYNELKSRFSKLAGDKLTDQNPDIADLSDPNRAMKLSEKFGGLYDDAWTDAFEQLTGKQKQTPRQAIQFLLDRLKECWGICTDVAETWVTALNTVYLHPVQKFTDAMNKIQGGKQGIRLGSKEQRVIRDACRKIGPVVGTLVKQYYMLQLKKEDQKLNEVCKPYLEGCVDVCWLMVLAEPPLHIDFNINPGERFDPNRHAAHSESGDTVKFLVWPPLYNAKEGGGMLSKGTVSTERKVEKPTKQK